MLAVSCRCNIELEQCPFCKKSELLDIVKVAETSSISTYDQRPELVEYFKVECNHCHASGPVAKSPDGAALLFNKYNES